MKYVAYYTCSNTIGIGIVGVENDRLIYEWATQSKRRTCRRQIYYNMAGEPFVNFGFGRVYLSEIMRCI